jgi:hypothetical protein
MARKTQKPLLGFRANQDEFEKMNLFRKATGRSMSNILRRVWAQARLSGVSDLIIDEPDSVRGRDPEVANEPAPPTSGDRP